MAGRRPSRTGRLTPKLDPTHGLNRPGDQTPGDVPGGSIRTAPERRASPRSWCASPSAGFGNLVSSVRNLTIVLSLLGGACELGGLALVVRGILTDRKRAKKLFPRTPSVSIPQRRYPGRISAPGPNPWAGVIRQSPGELEHQVGKGLAMLGNAIIEHRKAVDAQHDAGVAELRHKALEREAEMRSHLGYVLVGGIGERAVGASLLAVGLILGVAANIASVS
jgi:hypothetical protein